MIARTRLAIATAATLACVISASGALQAQIVPAEEARVAALLAASKYPSVRHTEPKQAVWSIARRTDARGEFKVVVTVQNGILIVFVTVAEKANIRRVPELDQKLLKLNHDYDFVKIGIDGDEDLSLRIDAHLRLVDSTEFDYMVAQVVRATDLVFVALKPYLR